MLIASTLALVSIPGHIRVLALVLVESAEKSGGYNRSMGEAKGALEVRLEGM